MYPPFIFTPFTEGGRKDLKTSLRAGWPLAQPEVQNRQKWGFARGVLGVPKNGKKVRFWAKKGRKMAIFDHFGQKFFQKCDFCHSIAPRLKGLSPLWENPPIYTVLNAAFSAPDPPSGDTVVGHHSPAASHGLPEPPPAIRQTPCRHP